MLANHPTARCHAEYERHGGRRPGDRIIRCHLPAGHPGEHEEDDTEVTWAEPSPAQAPPPADHPDGRRNMTAPGPAADLIEYAAKIIVAKRQESYTAPYHWAGALWESGMLVAPGTAPPPGNVATMPDEEHADIPPAPETGEPSEPQPAAFWEKAVLRRFIDGGPVDTDTVRTQVAALLAEHVRLTAPMLTDAANADAPGTFGPELPTTRPWTADDIAALGQVGSDISDEERADSRNPDAYAKYAAQLDESVPGWWNDPLERMAPGLAAEAQHRLDELTAERELYAELRARGKWGRPVRTTDEPALGPSFRPSAADVGSIAATAGCGDVENMATPAAEPRTEAP